MAGRPPHLGTLIVAPDKHIVRVEREVLPDLGHTLEAREAREHVQRARLVLRDRDVPAMREMHDVLSEVRAW